MAHWLQDSPEHRLTQVFLSKQSGEVFEVYWRLGTDRYECTCPGFDARDRCVHVDFVLARVSPGLGYPIQNLRDHVASEDLRELMKDHVKFRWFILEHAKIEMVP